MPRKCIPVIHTDSQGRSREYNSILAASLYTGIKIHDIRKFLNSEDSAWQYAESRQEDNKSYKKTRPVISASPDTGEIISEYVSIREAAEMTGSSYKCISECCKYKDRLYKRTVYMFKDEYSNIEARYVKWKHEYRLKQNKKMKTDI